MNLWVLDKELPITGQELKYCFHIFGIRTVQIGSWYYSEEQLHWMFQFSSVKVCICNLFLYISIKWTKLHFHRAGEKISPTI